MKRILLSSVICLNLVVCLMLAAVGCTAKYKKGAILVSGFSDSVPEIRISREIKEWNEGTFIDKKQPERRDVYIGEERYTGMYINSEHIYGSYEIRHSYLDDKNNVFEVNDSGKLIAYFWGNGEPSEIVKNENECRGIALSLISKLYDVDLNNYEEQITFNSNLKTYSIVYYKLINEIETEDRIAVEVEETGHIYSFRAGLFGKMSGESAPSFDLEETNNAINKRLDDLTKSAREKYDSVKYTDCEYRLSMINDKDYILLYSTNVECCTTVKDEFEFVQTEKIRFVVIL